MQNAVKELKMELKEGLKSVEDKLAGIAVDVASIKAAVGVVKSELISWQDCSHEAAGSRHRDVDTRQQITAR